MAEKRSLALDDVKRNLHPGQVYRRADLLKFSNALDRHLRQLTDEGVLQLLAGGLYYAPKSTTFGSAPPDDSVLVKAFLKDHRFLLYSPNVYNALGVGATQLYSETIVYNHKRHGRIKLGSRTYDFRMKPHFPLEVSREFLLVDLVNNIRLLAEDEESVLAQVKVVAAQLDKHILHQAVSEYGGVRAQKFFAALPKDTRATHA